MKIEGECFLVTGGLGFIGRHLARALVDRGASVVAFDREERRADAVRDLARSGRLEVRHGDLRTADLAPLLSGCTAVIHLAASADVRVAEQQPRPVFEENVLATARLLDAIAAAGIRQFAFPSTSTVYGEATVVPTPEDYTPLVPVSMYGASKLAAEGLIHGFAAKHDVGAVIWRFANVVGGGGTHGVLYDLVNKLRANPVELEILGQDPGTRKSYVHIDDAIDAILRSWDLAGRGVETFNVGSEDAITVREVADLVVRATGLSNVRYRWTGGVDGGGWKGDVRTMALAVDKLKARGWRPRYGSADAVFMAAKALASGPSPVLS